jgi:3-oxoacyl-(acyl-carrier-protein) synthase
LHQLHQQKINIGNMAPMIQNGVNGIKSNGTERVETSFDNAKEAAERSALDTHEDALEPIAIVGMSAKLPQSATSPEAFWKLLKDGRSAMTEVPPDRFNIDAFYHPDGDRLNTLNVRGGHFLQGDLAEFDAPFFSIPRTEAESLDPQQRGLLESTYHAFENAGISLQEAAGTKTAVFVGCFAKEYETLFARDTDLQPKYQASGTGSAMLANRISWFYDLKGPSITLDTACSSSLNALHLACQSIRTKESTMVSSGRSSWAWITVSRLRTGGAYQGLVLTCIGLSCRMQRYPQPRHDYDVAFESSIPVSR